MGIPLHDLHPQMRCQAAKASRLAKPAIIQGDAGEQAAAARVRQNRRVHQRVGPGAGVATDRSGRNPRVGAQLDDVVCLSTQASWNSAHDFHAKNAQKSSVSTSTSTIRQWLTDGGSTLATGLPAGTKSPTT